MTQVGVKMHLCLSTAQRRIKLCMKVTFHDFLTPPFEMNAKSQAQAVCSHYTEG